MSSPSHSEKLRVSSFNLSSTIDCLLRAQDSLAKARSGGFPLPDDVAQVIQELMTKIPELIAKLEKAVTTEGQEPRGNQQTCTGRSHHCNSRRTESQGNPGL